jgi:hypothetical protein
VILRVDSVRSGWSVDSLHRLVVSTGTVRGTKTRDIYGHFWTATHMGHTDGTDWSKDPTARIITKALALNDVRMSREARLHQLRTAAVGGILLVTQIPGVHSAEQEAFITIIASVSVAAYAQDAADASLIYDGIWDELAIAALPSQLLPIDLSSHCSHPTLDPMTKLSLSSDYNIFVHNPSHLFHSEILQAIISSPQGGFLSQIQGVLEASLCSVQVTVASTY